MRISSDTGAGAAPGDEKAISTSLLTWFILAIAIYILVKEIYAMSYRDQYHQISISNASILHYK